jgi:hypothetical protein
LRSAWILSLGLACSGDSTIVEDAEDVAGNIGESVEQAGDAIGESAHEVGSSIDGAARDVVEDPPPATWIDAGTDAGARDAGPDAAPR